MADHTPGPWRASQRAELGAGDPDNPWDVIGMHLHIDIASSHQEADARLIAAAPDLLKAAQFALRVLTGNQRPAGHQLEAAIHKAVHGQGAAE